MAQNSHRKMARSSWSLIIVIFCFLIAWLVPDVYGLKCFVGLGNSSKKREMKVVDCPEGKFYVCVKMFGGGMGDQIRRYCEAIPREDYQDLMEKEDFKETESPDVDPTCYETIHNGREVRVCLCTGDKCNAATSYYNTQGFNWTSVAGLTAMAWWLSTHYYYRHLV